MSFLDKIPESADHRRRPVRGGAVLAYYKNLNDQDRHAFDAWIADGKSLTTLWRACREDGLDVAAPTFYGQMRALQIAGYGK